MAKLEESAQIKLFLSKLDEKLQTDEYIEEIHNKFKTKLFFKDSIYTKTTHHFFIKKILKYIDYFLATGPLTMNEHKLFIEAVELMKEYYINHFNKTDREDIVFPPKNTPVYALFFADKIEAKGGKIAKTI